MRRSGRVFAPLGAVLLALGIGFAIGPWREPAGTLVAAKSQPSAAATAVKGKPADSRAASTVAPARAASAEPAFKIKCKIKLVSCRRWLALQERKGQLLMRSAER